MSCAEAPAQRLFFALWPEPSLQSRLYKLGGQFHAGSGGKRVRADNLHITLAFLGSVDAQTRSCLEAKAGAILCPAFNLALDRAGFWPRPRVLWLGAEESPQPLQELVRGINRCIAECGLEPEKRPFHAHLTLLRKAKRGTQWDSPEPIQWPVDEFVLVESSTLPEGAEYRVIARWPLEKVSGNR